MKKYRLAGILAAGLLMLVMLIGDRLTFSYQLSGVSDAVKAGDMLYIIDNQGENFQIFATDGAGVITGRINLPKLDGEWWKQYSSLCVDEDGQVYVYCYARTMDMTMVRSTVFYCDFEKAAIQQRWELTDMKMFKVQVTEGCVYYLVTEPDGRAGFYRQDGQGNQECLLRPDVDYSQVKGYGWDEAVGFLWVDGNGRFYRNDELIKNDLPRDYVNICVDQHGIAYTDMSDEMIYHIGWQDDKVKPLFSLAEVRLEDQTLEYSDLLPIDYCADGSWVAAVDREAGRRSAGLFDRQGRQVSQLDILVKPWWQRVLFAGRLGSGCIAVLLILVLLIKAMLFYTKGLVPILFQLFCVLLPVMILAGVLLDREIRIALKERFLKMQYELLYVYADEELQNLDLQKFLAVDLTAIPQDPYYQELFRRESFGSVKDRIAENGTREASTVIADTYRWLYRVDEGELRFLEVTNRHYYGSRVLYGRNREELEKMQAAMDTRQIILSQYNDFAGSFIVLYVPIITSEGITIGVAEYGISQRVMTYEITRQMAQIHQIIRSLMLLLAAVLVLVLEYFLRPLHRVRAAVEDVSRGDFDLELAVRGRDEVAGITRAVNEMSRQLKEHIHIIQESSDRYAAFVPRKIFEILDRPDITRIELGDQKELPAAILEVESSQFYQMARQMDGDALYGMVNAMLQEMIPLVTAREGIVENMAGNGLTACYPGGSRPALLSAISICERMNEMLQNVEQVPFYQMVIHYGRIRFGIIGQQQRMAAGTISEAMNLVLFLRDVGDKYRIRILVTESAVKQIDDFAKRFHVRLVGYIHLRGNQSLEAIYDVYDGDMPGQRRQKEETKDLFAGALEDYLAQRYYDARLKFARVLRQNPQDRVAREYVYRCDDYYQSEGGREMEIWLEQY